jgi:ferredoxin-NADP reductase
VTSVHLSGRRLDRLGPHAGQFFLWRFLDARRFWQAHPFSISTAPDGRSLRLTVKAVGGYTRRLADLRPGTRVVAEGPFGTFTAQRRRRERVLLIAGGIGITPLRALFQTIPAAPGDLTLLYRASTDWDVVFRSELERLAAQRRANLHVVTGRRADLGWDPLSSQALAGNIPDLRAHDVYLCGPAGMTSAVRQALRAAGVPGRRIHSESFEF